MTAVLVFLLVIFAYGPRERAEAAEKAGVVSAVADAKVIIYRRVELRHDGFITSDDLDRYALMQVDAHECDPEPRRTETACVFLIYEIQ